MVTYAQRFPLACVVILLVLAFFSSGCGSDSDYLRGTVLKSNKPSYDFSLTDQFGQLRKLTQFQGDVVLLTFLYTNCVDICPVVADYLKEIHQDLGTDVDEVTFIIISVDPEGDTLERTYQYSERWGMLHQWLYLVGTREELEPVWKSYFVSAFADDKQGSGYFTTTSVVHYSSSRVADLVREIPLRDKVSHSSPIYLIDLKGQTRVLYTLPFNPNDIVNDIKILLN